MYFSFQERKSWSSFLIHSMNNRVRVDARSAAPSHRRCDLFELQITTDRKAQRLPLAVHDPLQGRWRAHMQVVGFDLALGPDTGQWGQFSAVQGGQR
jgi:hypothetical protein